jgi:LPS-assembly protein
MGRRICPSEFLLPGRAGGGRAPARRRKSIFLARIGVCHARAAAAAFWLALVFCFAVDWSVNSAAAQSPLPAESPPVPDGPKKTDDKSKTADEKPRKMFVEASELVYNKDKNTISAEGNARVYYKGSVLEADRVVYDRNTGRVYAEGKAQLRQPDGTLIHADRFDLTEDFRDGFIQSLRTDTTDKTFISAPQAERSDGNVTVYDKGTYTACKSCQDDPERPPLWRVRARRIIHNADEQMLYYQDAWLEFAGIPVAYMPVFSGPDPSVTHKSGILSPIFIYNPQRGFGYGVPIYWALAPSYDLTLSPVYYTNQGFFGTAEWRQKFDNGSYYIWANGIFQQDPTAFVAAPYGAGNQVFRGSIESKGSLDLTKEWKFGWDATILSDKFFLTDYSVPSQTRTSNYFSETISDIYLTGQSNRSYFDIRGYVFEGLAAQDFQPQQPLVHPVWDYNRTVDVDPAKSWGLGGQVTFDYNFTSLSEQAASYQAVGQPQLDNAYNLHQVCTNYTPGTTTGSCLLRGIGGDYTRLTAELAWKRKVIDPLGGVWTPFAFARVNGEWLNLNTSQSYTFSSPSGSSTFSNASQTNFTGTTDAFYGTAMPGVGLEYRYPLISKTPYGSLTVEPIGQIIARPDEGLGAQSPVNMDAQSLVFDDTTLFAWDKYSGYDRFESGVRANYGGQASFGFLNGGYVNFIAGQSYQVAGTNNYATPDAANVGLSSGLDTRASDYVGAFTFAPNSAYSFIAKGRFDVTTFEPRRIDLISQYNLGAWTGSVQYADYQAQPLIGYFVRREGLTLNSKYKITDHYFVDGSITFDMSREFYPDSIIGDVNPGPFAIAAMGLGFGYEDECTTFKVRYNSYYTVSGPTSLQQNQVYLVELQLRTLGGTKYTDTTTTSLSPDSIR